MRSARVGFVETFQGARNSIGNMTGVGDQQVFGFESFDFPFLQVKCREFVDLITQQILFLRSVLLRAVNVSSSDWVACQRS